MNTVTFALLIAISLVVSVVVAVAISSGLPVIHTIIGGTLTGVFFTTLAFIGDRS